MSTGAGECIDSFFAFGFIEISKRSDDYPIELIKVMEPIVQEEARHILFIQNWLLYQRRKRPYILQGIHFLMTMWAFASAGWSRLMDLKNLGGSAFTIQARDYEGPMSTKDFINLCQKENKRRLAPYDSCLARPKLVPRIMNGVIFFL